jgi:hypothetical protein
LLVDGVCVCDDEWHDEPDPAAASGPTPSTDAEEVTLKSRGNWHGDIKVVGSDFSRKLERQHDELRAEYAAYREKNERDEQVELTSAHDHIERIKKERDELQDKVTELTGREAKASGRLETMTEGYETAVRQAAELQARIDATEKQEPVGSIHKDSVKNLSNFSIATIYPNGWSGSVTLYAAPTLSPPAESDAERYRRALHLAQWIAQSLFEMGDIPASHKKVAAMFRKILEVMK